MVNNFFNVIAKRQTYLNMFYLLISFPLGIFYFVFLVTGISLGLGLIVTLIGIPILILMTFLWYWMGAFERQFTSIILGTKIRSPQKMSKQKSLWNKIKKHLSKPITWKSLAYLFIKFPLGIFSFVFLVTLLSVSLSLIATPLIYYLSLNNPSIQFATVNGVVLISSYWHATIVSIIGLISLFISMHILNGIAYVSGLLAKILLGSQQQEKKVGKKVRKKKRVVKKKTKKRKK